VQIGDATYQANWHTSEDNLDPSCTYRIAVQTGSRQLGVADVDVVEDGSELKNVDTDEFIHCSTIARSPSNSSLASARNVSARIRLR